MNVTATGVWMDPTMGKVLDALHLLFPAMTLALSDHGENVLPENSYKSSFQRQNTISLPRIHSLPQALTAWPACSISVHGLLRRSEALIVQIPFEAPACLNGVRLPTLYHIIADIKNASAISRYRGLVRPVAMATGWLLEHFYCALVKRPRCRAVANGERIYHAYGRPAGRSVVSSALSESDFDLVRRMRPVSDAFRVVYVGQLHPCKGVEFLIRAFRAIKNEVRNSKLLIVGAASRVDKEYERGLQRQVEDLGLQESVEFGGHVAFGRALFQVYADSDVLVLPSLSGEGTPRVLVEARAFGCPVIATRVGGVESSVEHACDGILIDPSSAESIAESAIMLFRDQGFRQQLIDRGRQRARTLTVESYAANIAYEVEMLVRPKRRPYVQGLDARKRA